MINNTKNDDKKPLMTNNELQETYKKILSSCEEDRKDVDKAFSTFIMKRFNGKQ